jgi:hypothetical protein
MTLSLAIALNLIASLGLLGGLAYVMTRPAQLRPHEPSTAQVIELQLVRNDREQPREAA